MHIIELSKAESLHAFPPALTAWIACVRHNLEEDRMSQIEHPPVREALKHLEHMYSEEELRMAAERRVQALVDEQDALDYATLKGRNEGRQEGQVRLLVRLLTARFGPLPSSVQARLQQAEDAILLAWAEKVLTASSLDDVFR